MDAEREREIREYAKVQPYLDLAPEVQELLAALDEERAKVALLREALEQIVVGPLEPSTPENYAAYLLHNPVIIARAALAKLDKP